MWPEIHTQYGTRQINPSLTPHLRAAPDRRLHHLHVLITSIDEAIYMTAVRVVLQVFDYRVIARHKFATSMSRYSRLNQKLSIQAAVPIPRGRSQKRNNLKNVAVPCYFSMLPPLTLLACRRKRGEREGGAVGLAVSACLVLAMENP